MRLLIMGNSGSGKSYRARALAEQHGLTHLDLDTIVWEPGRIAVPRAPEQVRADLLAFIARHEAWVAEGCYGDLVEAARPYCSELVFMNPGREVCLENNRRWVGGYEEREDAMSYAYHRHVFDGFNGDKTEVTVLA
jgi:adenylate kinase family enzyme